MLDYEFGQRKASLLQQQIEQLKKISAVMQQRLDAGDIARPDVIAAQISLNKTQHDLSDARAGAADARARLAAAIGLPEAALDGIQIVFNPVDDGAALTSAEARRLALTSRADVRSALADYAAAEADLRLQIAKQYPDIHIGPGYQWNSGQAGDSEWILGLNLELPLLDRNQGPIAEAEARRKLAAARFVELQSQIISQIDRAAAALRVAREQWRIGSDLIASEEKQQRAAQAQVQAGAGGQIDLLTAQVEITSASLAQLDNEAKIQAALSGLEDALQRPAGNIAAAIATISK
jgi:outer membrane protein TolC